MDAPIPRPDPRSVALHYTGEIAGCLVANRYPPPEIEIRTDFPPVFAADERVWVQGGFVLEEFSATGDGSYESSHFIAGGTGVLGLGLLAATWGASAAGNRRRREAAARAREPHWHRVDQGTVYVSRYGMYLRSPGGLFPWSWFAITAADLPRPGVLQFTGTTTNGLVEYALTSDWAELTFLAWALARHPRHPRLADGSWYPGGWRGTPPDPALLSGG